MALQFHGYGPDPGEETRRQFQSSLDGIFQAYQQAKQHGLAERDRQGSLILSRTPDPRQAKAALDDPKHPLHDSVLSYIQRRDQERSMKEKSGRAELAKTESETEENLAQADRLRREAPAAAGGLKPENKAQIEGQIMDDYLKSPTFTNLAAAKSGLRDLASIQSNKSGAADIAAIYSFIKTMDNNAVKEGEINLAQSALPGLDRVKLIYDSMKAGNKLTPQMKRELLTVGKGMYDSKLKSAEEFRSPFVARAKQYGIDPNIAVPGLSIPEQELLQMFGAPQVETRRLKNGQTVKVARQADGSYVEVP